MTPTTIAQSASTSAVFKYSFTVVHFENSEDREESVAAFPNEPTLQDWFEWLKNWYEIGYKLQSPPQLISVS